MGSVVFISHASSDTSVAGIVCRALESAGVPCWIAPRDVRPGTPYAGRIVSAIQGVRVMVLILSRASNASDHVLREVNQAVNGRTTIIPFCIEPVTLTRDMDYYLGTPHRLDATATIAVPGL